MDLLSVGAALAGQLLARFEWRCKEMGELINREPA